MAGIELINVHKQYRVEDRTVPVLRGIGLQIPERQITVILGRSGCGKTTLLRLTGGLEEADAGEIRYEGPHRTAFVFQEPRLMPWLTVWGNVTFGLEKREISRKKVEDIIATVGLTGFEKACDDALTAYLSAARRIPFGEQTVVGYLYAKEAELTAIRTIFAGRAAGLDGDTIRARLRETYV